MHPAAVDHPPAVEEVSNWVLFVGSGRGGHQHRWREAGGGVVVGRDYGGDVGGGGGGGGGEEGDSGKDE